MSNDFDREAMILVGGGWLANGLAATAQPLRQN
jgi:hypothetical protein